MLMKTRKMYQKNPLIGYLNINSVRTKILSLNEILHKAPIDILCIDESKLDETFPRCSVYDRKLPIRPF